MAEVVENAGWAETIRRAPVGVLVMGGALCLLAAGFVLGGAYLAIANGGPPWVPLASALLAGPLLLYVGLHLLRLSSWAWLAMVLLIALLFASSVVRAILSPEAGLSPYGEMVFEATVLLYLRRPAVRAAFGRA